MKSSNSFEALAGAASQVIQLALPALGLALICVFLAYFNAPIMAALTQVFAIAAAGFQAASAVLTALASRITPAFRPLRDVITKGGRLPLAGVVVIVLLVVPALLGLMAVDRMLWGEFYASLFQAPVSVPLLGEVALGDVFAVTLPLLAVVAGALLDLTFGWPVDPFGTMGSEAVARRVKLVIRVVSGLLLAGLLIANWDMAENIYAQLGEQRCAAEVAFAEVALPSPAASPIGSFAVAVDEGRAAASPEVGKPARSKEECLAAWESNRLPLGVFRMVTVGSIIVAAVFSFSLLMGVGLIALVATAGTQGLIGLGAWLCRGLGVAMGMLAALAGLILAIPVAVGTWILGLFGVVPPAGGGGGGGGPNAGPQAGAGGGPAGGAGPAPAEAPRTQPAPPPPPRNGADPEEPRRAASPQEPALPFQM